jgi:hypothetical protein
MHWCTFLLALAAPALSFPLSSRGTGPASNRALWLWESDIIKDSAAMSKFFSVVTDNDFTKVHALIDRDMGNAAWESFIAQCNTRGISVEALMGDAQWVLGKTTENGPTLQHQLDWIEQYQKSAPQNAQFSGIHMDVEPWGLDGWTSNKETYIDSFVGIVDTVVSFAKHQSLHVAADLPFWANTVPCKDATLDTCLLGHLNSVTFMTYRNTATELIDVAAPLLKAVADAHSGSTVWLSVETSSKCAEAELISYAGKGVKTLMGDLVTVGKHAAVEGSGFAGIAVHSYTEFVALG